MRQFVSPRFWAALAALLAVTAGLWLFLVRDNSKVIANVVHPRRDVHRIDLVSLVYAVQEDPGFAMHDGKANGSMRLIIDGSRTMLVTPGTPGEMSCTDTVSLARCVVAADLLGNAVVWFSLVSGAPAATVDLPGVVDVRANNWVVLANGWELRRSSEVELVCDDDTSSLGDFVDRFGEKATAVYDFDRQQVTKVVCPQAPVATTTSTTTTTLFPPTSVGPAVPISSP